MLTTFQQTNVTMANPEEGKYINNAAVVTACDSLL